MPATTINRRSRNQKLGFTLPQQIKYRELVNAAWATFCRQSRTDAKDKVAKREWYELHLEAATGKASTTLCNRTNDFDEAMKEFEAAAGDSIYWQTRNGGKEGELRRARHGLQEFCREHDVEDAYVLGISRQMFDCADLTRLQPNQIRDVLIALKLQLVRPASLPLL